jgi:hypothetical protein
VGHHDCLWAFGLMVTKTRQGEEVLPRRPILASDGTSGSVHVFSTPKSQATTQVEEGKGS